MSRALFFSPTKKGSNLMLDNSIFECCTFLDEINENTEDLHDKDYIYNTYLRVQENKDEMKKLANKIANIIERSGSRIGFDVTIYVSNYTQEFGYLYAMIIHYCSCFLYGRPLRYDLLEIDFDSLDNYNSYDEEEEEEEQQQEQFDEEFEEDSEEEYSFKLPTSLPEPNITSQELEKLIGYVPVRKDIQYIKKTDPKTDENFKQNRKLNLRAGYELFSFRNGEVQVVDFGIIG